MGYDLYNGDSDGFKMLVDGYIDYAEEIIARRSFPDLRDGLKPIGRRILYQIKTTIKKDGFSKCGTLVGRVMEIHPHGDASIYGAMANMTDINGSLNVPLLEGNGDFGRVYSNGGPAAMRYTKAKLNSNAEDFFRDMEACNLVPSEEGEGTEPDVLPVRYPICLINGTSGMAVSVATEIPSFNFNDVISLTIKGIQDGFDNLDVKDNLIAPDLPSGGVLVKDDAELAKIMRVGKGKLKVRAKVEIRGKEIFVTEVPYGRTVEGIVKAISNAGIYGITNVCNYQGFDSEALLIITCKTQKIVEDVLLELYRQRILQSSITSNMLFINNGSPMQIGVYDTLQEWVEWRRKVCKLKFSRLLDSIADETNTLSYFMRLLSNEEWKNTYIDLAVHRNKKEASDYLKQIMPGIPEEVCEWIVKRSLASFNNGGRYSTRYDDLMHLREMYNGYLSDIDAYIISDLQALLKEKGRNFPRKTLLTTKDYRFSKIQTEEYVDDSFCYYVLKNDGFLLKVRSLDGLNLGNNVLCKIPAQANSTLIGFDNYGRLLRVYGTDISFTTNTSAGEYLPKYFGVADIQNVEGINYKIMYMSVLDGKRRILLYKDGYVGFLDTSEFLGKKKIKVNYEGVDTRVMDKLLEVYHEDDLKDYLVVADDHYDPVRFGIIDWKSLTVKSRRSRTKALKGNTGDIACTYSTTMSIPDTYSFSKNPSRYFGSMRPHREDIVSDLSEFKEGRYYVEGSIYEDNES